MRQYYIEKGVYIESLLKKHGATGKGLKNLAESIPEKIDEAMKKSLKQIGWVRNQAAHEENFSISARSAEEFEKNIKIIETTLRDYKQTTCYAPDTDWLKLIEDEIKNQERKKDTTDDKKKIVKRDSQTASKSWKPSVRSVMGVAGAIVGVVATIIKVMDN